MRSLNDIKRELDAAAARRSELWKRLSEIGADEATSTEVAELSERIESLYNEARIVRSRARFGEQEAIIARARAEERLDRELAKVA